MATTQFHLVTNWTFGAAPVVVWAALSVPEEWPTWWRAVKCVEILEPGDATGIGTLRRFTWRRALLYTITIEMRTLRIEPLALIEGQADGELTGTGTWTLSASNGGTQVCHDWIVDVTKPWMRLCAPLLRPVFAWNHRRVMQWGYDGLKRKLGEP